MLTSSAGGTLQQRLARTLSPPHPNVRIKVIALQIIRRICERQTPSGGLNGRPEKLQDVCYSWWCLSALAILGRLHWIDTAALRDFVLDCQDEDGGGISDRPEDEVDVYHTFFGVAGLSLMGYPGLAAVDPTLALPVEVVDRMKARRKQG